MYLSRLRLNTSRMAVLWSSNPYRVHQRLLLGCGQDQRLLFRIERNNGNAHILAQTQAAPDWKAAFADFPVLAGPVETKTFVPRLVSGKSYRFRLLANPTAKKTFEEEEDGKKKRRLGLVTEDAQVAWLKRKMEQAGAELLDWIVIQRGKWVSHKNPAKEQKPQTHLAVQFDGLLQVKHAELFEEALASGIGSAKAYGFGLLSLGPA